MDSDGLPIVGDGIDFTKVGAIHQKRTLAFLNHFISHTVRFLNRFSNVCEEKLEDLSCRLQRIEITMNILEAKLSSVAGLENVAVASSSDPSTAPTAAPTAGTDTASAAQESVTEVPAPVEEVPPVPTGPTVSQVYKKYFTMLNMGVNIMAIQQKMRSEGVDPELINTPDAPAPPATTQTSDSDDEASDLDSDD